MIPGLFQHMGSSPLARGTHLLATHPEVAAGLIPARAGNTIPCPFVVVSVRAHPRSRGEHEMAKKKKKEQEGSSPLARGTR